MAKALARFVYFYSFWRQYRQSIPHIAKSWYFPVRMRLWLARLCHLAWAGSGVEQFFSEFRLDSCFVSRYIHVKKGLALH